jgi:hypothetical protein
MCSKQRQPSELEKMSLWLKFVKLYFSIWAKMTGLGKSSGNAAFGGANLGRLLGVWSVFRTNCRSRSTINFLQHGKRSARSDFTENNLCFSGISNLLVFGGK